MIYLDHAATAPVRRAAVEAMWPYLTGRFGNPSSAHDVGRRAAAGLEAARAQVASALGARPGQVVFTSGGTESNATAVLGAVRAALAQRPVRVLTTALEHSSVRAACEQAERVDAAVVERLDVDADGRIDLANAARRLGHGADAQTRGTTLVAVHLANNEIGTVQPIRKLAELTRAAGVPLHVDAVQAAGQIPLDVRSLGADSLALSGHKVGAPQGIGALWLRPTFAPEPLLPGGGQERGRRSGTQNVAGAVGLAAAMLEAVRERRDRAAAWARGRHEFVARVLDGVRPHAPRARLTGHPDARLPRHASFVLPGVNGESVLVELERSGVVASAGSACSAHDAEPSPVLTALGLSADEARTALRFTFGPDETPETLRAAADAVVAAVAAVARLT